MRSKNVLRKGDIIFLLLPTCIDENGVPNREGLFNLAHISSIDDYPYPDTCTLHMVGSLSEGGQRIFMPYQTVKTIIKAAMEDDLQDIIPIVSRSEILEIEK